MPTLNSFLIGADPEFIVVNRAGEHVNVKPYTTKEAEVAWDHEGDVMEVKPKPSKYAFRLVRRMRKLLLQHEVSKKLTTSGFKFRSGGYLKTKTRSLGLGGHIHFDVPFKEGPRTIALYNLTAFLENLDILPKTHSRYRHDYQVIEPIRPSNDGTRLEFRHMCSWLHSPIAAQVCLTAAKITATYPELGLVGEASIPKLQSWFEKWKTRDSDVARVVEKIFEPKLPLEARLDLDLQDTWKSLKQLGGVE